MSGLGVEGSYCEECGFSMANCDCRNRPHDKTSCEKCGGALRICRGVYMHGESLLGVFCDEYRYVPERKKRKRKKKDK